MLISEGRENKAKSTRKKTPRGKVLKNQQITITSTHIWRRLHGSNTHHTGKSWLPLKEGHDSK